MLLHRDELAGWIGGFDRYAQYGGGDVARWLSIFNAEAITVDRKTDGTTYVPKPCVWVFGGIQPDRLPAVLTKTLRDCGLLARFLIVSPPPRPKRFNAASVHRHGPPGAGGVRRAGRRVQRGDGNEARRRRERGRSSRRTRCGSR